MLRTQEIKNIPKSINLTLGLSCSSDMSVEKMKQKKYQVCGTKKQKFRLYLAPAMFVWLFCCRDICVKEEQNL